MNHRRGAGYGGDVLLAMDTATPMTTVALVQGEVVLAERGHADRRKHAELLATFIHEVLTEACVSVTDLQGIAVGVGPGTFTGLRVGLVTARSLGLALSLPVHGVMTLDAMAFACDLAEPFTVVTDARRQEVFWATYKNADTRRDGPFVGSSEQAALAATPGAVVGAAMTPFAETFDDVRTPDLPSAGALGLLAARRLERVEPLMSPDPLYLRRPDVSPTAGPKSVLS